MKSTPFILKTWFFLTRYFSWPIVLGVRRLHRRMGADPKRFAERLGQVGPATESASAENDVIWFHAASLGEVKQIGTLVEHLVRSGNVDILITTVTAAGADWVEKEIPLATHRYLPIDTPAAVRAFLTNWSPSVAIFIEGDIWPRLITELQRRDIPRVILNARHSRSRARLRRVYEVFLPSFALVTCRSQTAVNEFLELGVQADRVQLLPDLRLTLPALTADTAAVGAISETIGSKPNWLAASTHISDEEAVLNAHRDVVQKHPDALLFMAPRHPKRGAAINKMARDMGFSVAQRSLGDKLTADRHVYIVDTLGELGTYFSVSPIVFLGGSFGTEGGHNPYEPAQFGTAIISGSNVKNFAEAYTALNIIGAAELIAEENQLGPEVLSLMQADRRAKMSKAALGFMQEAQQSSTASAELIHRVRARHQNDAKRPKKTD